MRVWRRSWVGAGLAVAVAIVGVVPGPAAVADTGGRQVTYLVGHSNVPYHVFDRAVWAPAGHPRRSHRIGPPLPRGAKLTAVLPVVPSPDGRRVAVAYNYLLGSKGRFAITVMDRDGSHPHRVVTYRGNGPEGVAGMTWSADERHLYWSPSIFDPSADGLFRSYLAGARVFPHGVGTPVRVPGSAGMAYPAVNPATGELAAVVGAWAGCPDPVPAAPASATIIVLQPRTGESHGLVVATASRSGCAVAAADLAWSPDGRRLAFDQSVYNKAQTQESGDVMVVTPSSSADLVVAISGAGTHIAELPTWQNSHTLWCSWWRFNLARKTPRTKGDLLSASVTGGVWKAPVNRTRTPRVDEGMPSFG